MQSLKTLFFPAVMSVRVPLCAPSIPPETGLSSIATPSISAIEYASRASSGVIVAVKIIVPRSLRPVAKSATTALTCSPFITITNTASVSSPT